MSWRMIRFGERDGDYGRKSDSDEFYEAMDMAKEGLERVCELAEEMREQYGQRYGMRGSYGRRDWEEDEMMDERRRRDSRGRYI